MVALRFESTMLGCGHEQMHDGASRNCFGDFATVRSTENAIYLQ